ncbi:Protein kinase domain [Myroides sp. A21]|uniref:protein kinase domain-containing protein n=1 Tax=Myroides sp. A21 TaxID=1583100 RepID=UPI000586053E|nr:AarF/UbiB family protein [Myroides sp. A21]AJA69757.1 Protein kinase domain [Myroides sp. A21]
MSVSKQDIITAIKNSDTFLKVPELQGAKPRLNKNGSPFAFVGGFNMVFQLEHQNKKWALRVWHVPMGKHTNRYRKISKYLSEKKLPYFADFIYDEKGILVNGTLIDTIRMEWLEGKLLKEYLEENLNNKSKLTKLANDFLEMCKTLRENKISHGDLQEGNILIDRKGSIKLVDYDSICIPEIKGQKELVTGLKGYQHPSRFKGGKASLKADYFSELVIYLSILSLSKNSNLWNKYQVKDTQYLLFTETDFEDFENSEIYKDLQKLSNSIKSLTRILNSYLSEKNYLNLTSFEHYLTAPKIINFGTNEKEILKGKAIELSWNIENFDKISINNGVGNVTGKHSISVSPTNTTTYKLLAENAFDKTENELTITVLPLPKIKEFRSKQQKIEHGKETQLVWDIENAEKVELHWLGNMEVVPNRGEKSISPTEHTNYKVIVTALDGITKEEKEITVQVVKRVEIKSFVSDLEFVVETLPVKLSWEIDNASSIILSSNMQADIDVTGKSEIEILPKRTAVFYLKANNELFSVTSSQIKIEVQNIPTFNPSIIPRLPSGKDLIPSFELDFKELSETILNESQIGFQTAMKPTKRFNILNSLQKILK